MRGYRHALLVSAASIGLAAAPQLAGAQDVTLEFVVWNYSLDTIQDNVAKFEEQNPGITVNVTDYTWPDYHDSLLLRFRGGTQTDVIYAGQDWLPAWASAGFLAPLDDIAPDRIDTLAEDLAGFTISDMTYDGQIYGLPYYADTISFIYNAAILEEHGIAVPATWAEVTEASMALKEAGMEYPIVYEYNQELPNFFDAFVAQVYGRGGDLFDEENRAVFDDPENAAYEQIEWLQGAVEQDLVAFENHESRIIPAMNTGNHAFTIVYNYVLAALNNVAEQPRAGEFALAPMPGEANSTLGFTKFYSITAQAAEDPAQREAAWKFVEFMAGPPYDVAERWAVEKGLGFGQLPLLEDSDVIGAWDGWVDMDTLQQQVESARAGTWTEWTSVWSAYFRPLLAQAMVGDATVAEVTESGAQRWNELREQMAGN
ncbi:MAG: sugar ABC transporter substrate-binding protein [Azospirillaceae bacterium]